MSDNTSSNTFMLVGGGIILAVILLGVFLLGGAFFFVSSSSSPAPMMATPGPTPTGTSSSSTALTVRLVADPAQPGKVQHIEFNGQTYSYDQTGLDAVTQAVHAMPGNVSVEVIADDGLPSEATSQVTSAITGTNSNE